MTDEPEAPSRISPKQRRVLKWIGIAVAVPSVILFSLVAFFVARTEYMHDETRCPFHEVESRRVADTDARVLEESRTCQEGVEEHRWTVYRRDGSRRELGRRRLMDSHYEGYRWSVRSEDGSAVVEVRFEDVEDATFREAPPSAQNGR